VKIAGRTWIVTLLVALAGVMRVPHLDEPPLDFHPTRQYRAAIIARGLALPSLTHFTPAEREAARLAAGSEPPLEPPLLEYAAAWIYRLSGEEHLAFARALSVLAWLAVLAAVGAIGSRWFAGPGTVAAVAVAGFLPYTFPASQAFQPDALMTALIVVTLALLVAYDDTQRRRTVAWLTLAASAALFVKPFAILYIAPPALVLAWARRRWSGALAAAVWLLLVAVPAGGWYVHVMRTAPGALLDDRFFPGLLLRGAFWSGWSAMIARVVTWPVALLALAGIAAAPSRPRLVLGSVLAGYLASGFLVTHHISTHDYYSLPFVPVAALGVGAAVDALERALGRAARAGAAIAALGAAVLVVLLGTAAVRAVLPLAPRPDVAAQAAREVRIGRDVEHSHKVVSLDGNYGFSLDYNGRLMTSNLPLSIDLQVLDLAGRPHPDPVAALDASGAEYFAATMQSELDAQPTLERALEANHPLIERDGDAQRWNFVVYDLRRRKMAVSPNRISLFATPDARAYSLAELRIDGEPDVAWRVQVSAPDLLRVEPESGHGAATLTLRPAAQSVALDRAATVRVSADGMFPAHVDVRVKTVAGGDTAPPFGFVDAPADPIARLGSQPFVVQGWALDDFDLRRVWGEAVDGAGRKVTLGDAERTGQRADVAAAYPASHDNSRNAWLLIVRPDALGRLQFPVDLRIYAADGSGRQALIGHRTISAR
jgi:hypothetical protein